MLVGVSALTFIAVAIMVFGVLNRRGFGVALSAAGAFPAGAFLASAAVAVPVFYAVALIGLLGWGVLQLIAARRGLLTRQPSVPGVWPLTIMLLWGIVSTLVMPFVFNGMPVVNTSSTPLIAGVLTSSNIAQILYLAIGIGVVVMVARSPSTGPWLLGVGLTIALGLSFWKFLSTTVGLPFPDGLFDNSPTLVFQQTLPGGQARFRGIFSEPSSLGGDALVAAAFALSMAWFCRDRRSIFWLVLAVISVVLGLDSTSTTFVVAGAIVLVLAALAALANVMLDRFTLDPRLAVLIGALIIGSLWLVPMIQHFVLAAVNDKVGTASYTERGGAVSQAWTVFFNTWGFGAGLGSARASSFIPSLLASAGAPGTALFAVAVIGLLVRTVRIPQARPVLWALLTLFVVKAVAGPDLSDSTGVTMIGLGILAKLLLDKQAEEHASGMDRVALHDWTVSLQEQHRETRRPLAWLRAGR